MPDNRPWNLKSFLDSLIVELDKAQDTLALKGVNRPLTYTVRDVALELQIFPVYTPNGIYFSTAQPGQTGSSKVSLSLGSITDRQIRETTKPPVAKDDLPVEELDEIDAETRQTLRSIGVDSVKDLQRMEEKNIDIRKATGAKVDYRSLADAINKVHRQTQSRPAVRDFSLTRNDDGLVLSLSGENLVLDRRDRDFPIALVNKRPARVIHATRDAIHLQLSGEELQPGENDLTIALDRFSILRANLNA